MQGNATPLRWPSGHSLEPEAVLAQAIACRTIAGTGTDAFAALHAVLAQAFPRVQDALRPEALAPFPARLLIWPGSDPALRPWAILAHQDVVDAPASADRQWTYAPFAATVAHGCVWGRGALDMKCALVAVLHAVEDLLASDFAPRRTLMLSFGADEEIGGAKGAGLIAAALRAYGTQLAATFDEGGVILTDGFPGIAPPVALVGLAQKGEVVLRLQAIGTGGHGALPSGDPAVPRLLRALQRLHGGLLPGHIEGLPVLTMAALAAAASPGWRAVYRAVPTLDRLSGGRVSRQASLATLCRSTIAITRLAAGYADNVVPPEASATLDIRLRPGDSAAAAEAWVRAAVAPFDVAVTRGDALEASLPGTPEGPASRCLAALLRNLLPEVAVVPYVSPNDTDSKHFASIADEQIRFLPLLLRSADLGLIHGIDERIEVGAFHRLIAFYRRLIPAFDSTDDPPGGGAAP